MFVAFVLFLLLLSLVVFQKRFDTICMYVIKQVPAGCSLSWFKAIEGGPETAEKFFLEWEEEVR